MNVLILGCGSIGRRHAANVATVANLAVFDVDSIRAKDVADIAGGEAFFNLQSAIDWKPNAAVIAASTHQHIELATVLIENAIPVLIEKPISHSQDGVEDLLIKAKVMGVPVFVSCNMRYHLGPVTLKAALPSIGQPLFLRAQYGNYLPSMRPDQDYRKLYAARKSEGGGVILDSIHEIDYAAWLLGDIQSVICDAGTLSELEIDVEDYAALAATHVSGVRSEIHLDYLQRVKRRGCEIVGSEGTLLWVSEGKNPEQLEVRRFVDGQQGWETLASDLDYDANMPYKCMLNAFLALIRGEQTDATNNLLDGWDALKALRVCEVAHRSVKTNSKCDVELLTIEECHDS